MNIVRGKVITPPKVILYGPEGIGKSTLASKFPKPLFLDIEGGTNRLDVDRINVGTGGYTTVLHAISQLTADNKGYQTLVIDTADWLDSLITEKICQKAGKQGIEDFGYGKGFVYVKEEWARLLDSLTVIQTKQGMGIVFCAHAWLKGVVLPDESGQYDHWEMKMAKYTMPLLREWSDFMFFLKYDIIIVEDSETKKKKGGGGQRVVCTSHTPFWDAKTREKLPEQIRLDDAGLKTIMAAIYPTGVTAPAPAPAAPQPQPQPTPTPAPTPAPAPAPAQPDSKAPKVAQLLASLETFGYTREDLDMVVVSKGMYPTGTPIENFSEESIGRLLGNWDAIASWLDKKKGNAAQ